MNHTAAELLGPLEDAQACPPLFLLAQRGVYRLLGGSELSLRLLPMLMALAAMGLFARLAWMLLCPSAAVMATAMFALSDRIIWHASEAKQYSGDLLIAIVMLMLALPESGGRSAAYRLARTSAFAALALWFSHPTVFLFGGIALALMPAIIGRSRVRSDLDAADNEPPDRPGSTARGLLRFIAIVAPTAISFLALYFLSIRVQQTNMLFDYWADEFVNYNRPLLIPVWLITRSVSLFNYAYDLAGWVLLPLGIIGSILLWRTGRRQLLGALGLPIMLTLLAAALHHYPYDGTRLTLFLAPLCLLLAGFGIESAAMWLRSKPRVWRVALAGGLLTIGTIPAAYHLIVPRYRGHIRPVVEYVRAHRRANEGIYARNEKEFLCYWPNPDPRVHLGDWPREFPENRFWVLFTHSSNRDRQKLLPDVKNIAVQRQAYNVAGGTAVLFEQTNESPN